MEIDERNLAGRSDAVADGGSDLFRAGQRLFGEFEHAGKSANADADDDDDDDDDNEFAKVKSEN